MHRTGSETRLGYGRGVVEPTPLRCLFATLFFVGNDRLYSAIRRN